MHESGPTDQDLLVRIRGGDEQAWEELFHRYRNVIRKYAEQWLPHAVRRRVSVSDVIQEARIVASQRIDGFEDRGDGSLRNWLIRIVELKVREAVRRHVGTAKRARGNEVTRGMRADTGQFQGQGRSPSSMAANGELREQIETALAELPPDYQTVLRLTHQQQYTLAEAARHMGRSREAAKKLHGRAMARFSQELLRIRGNGDG
jgi:RNA polymerase sigma-70 factor (ECF subfamily)